MVAQNNAGPSINGQPRPNRAQRTDGCINAVCLAEPASFIVTPSTTYVRFLHQCVGPHVHSLAPSRPRSSRINGLASTSAPAKTTKNRLIYIVAAVVSLI